MGSWLPGPLKSNTLQKALAAARRIPEEDMRVHALERLSVHLPSMMREQILREALGIMREIGDHDAQARALVRLASSLPEPLLEQAAEATRKILDDYTRVQEQTALVCYLPETLRGSMLSEVLEAAQEIRDKHNRARALAGLVAFLPNELKDDIVRQALAAVQGIEEANSRARALAALVDQLPAQFLPQLLTMAHQTTNRNAKVLVLAKLATHFPEPLRGETLLEALLTIQSIEDHLNRARALTILTRLASPLPEPLFHQALAIAQDIREPLLCTPLFLCTAVHVSHIPLEMVPQLAQLGHADEALKTTIAIRDEVTRAQALSDLAPLLPELYVREALVAAHDMHRSDAKAHALTRLAERLPNPLREETLREALKAAREIPYTAESGRSWWGVEEHYDGGGQARALSELIPRLSESLKDEAVVEALAAARVIQDTDARAQILSELTPHLLQLPRQILYAVWRDTLRVLATRTRKDLLSDFCALEPIMVTLGQSVVMVETFHAIQDIGRWWP
jgi:hypothetical protein